MNNLTEELCILMLEDVETDAELVTQNLLDNGLKFTVMRVDTETSFIQALQEFSPHIILADYRLPAFSGRTALEYTRRHYPYVPVIMVTGALGDEAAVDLLKLGASDYVLKDNLLRLVPAIKRTLSEQKVARNRKAAENKFRTLFENAPLDIHELDLEGNIISMNPAGLHMWGYGDEEEAKANTYLDMVNDADQALVGTMLSKTISGEICHFEFKARNPYGRICKSCFVPIKGNDNRVEKLMVITEDITDAKLVEMRINYLANHDRMTELPNRELFYDRLSQAISQAKRKSERLAVFFLDLDGFKLINDEFGHDAGDVVLKIVSQRLHACVRSMDTVARLGGDEFAIILNEMGNIVDASNLAEKIIRIISDPMSIQDNEQCSVGISIGIAIYPENGAELDRLLNASDQAMYESKARTKSCYTFSNEQPNKLTEVKPWIVFDAKIRVGHQKIDREHEQIINLLNKLNIAVKSIDQTPVIADQVDEIISLVKSHFEAEEQLMENYFYPETLKHKQEHQKLLEDIFFLKKKLLNGGELVVLQSLKDWFLVHIMNFDKPLANYLVKHGVN